MSHEDLQTRIELLLLEEKKIEAIKVYRDATGASLSKAKDAVEGLERGRPLPVLAPASATPSDDALASVHALAAAGQTLQAIAAYREAKKSTLLEAKQYVESLGVPASASLEGFESEGAGRTVVLFAVVLVLLLLAGAILLFGT